MFSFVFSGKPVPAVPAKVERIAGKSAEWFAPAVFAKASFIHEGRCDIFEAEAHFLAGDEGTRIFLDAEFPLAGDPVAFDDAYKPFAVRRDNTD